MESARPRPWADRVPKWDSEYVSVWDNPDGDPLDEIWFAGDPLDHREIEGVNPLDEDAMVASSNNQNCSFRICQICTKYVFLNSRFYYDVSWMDS